LEPVQLLAIVAGALGLGQAELGVGEGLALGRVLEDGRGVAFQAAPQGAKLDAGAAGEVGHDVSHGPIRTGAGAAPIGITELVEAIREAIALVMDKAADNVEVEGHGEAL